MCANATGAVTGMNGARLHGLRMARAVARSPDGTQAVARRPGNPFRRMACDRVTRPGEWHASDYGPALRAEPNPTYTIERGL